MIQRHYFMHIITREIVVLDIRNKKYSIAIDFCSQNNL